MDHAAGSELYYPGYAWRANPLVLAEQATQTES